MGAKPEPSRWQQVDKLTMFRARGAAGVALEGDRLWDTEGRGRSDEQMERDVAEALGNL